ncbi:hypothetical protein [Streptomyces luteogriseus]|uniref:hypothetical protein n=1 Tax=Streptomyces luteogriseus TaxID=68233 RepID=UPI00379B2B2A
MTKPPTHYRGIEVPGRLRPYWNKPTGRWWRKGIDALAESMPFLVEPGQVYADNDPRKEGRTLRIESLDGLYAYAVDESTGITTRILKRRLYPNARGYRLIEDAHAA